MEQEPISVLIPTYNRQKFILQAIESIVNQTYKNICVLIYDDGSTDGTNDILRLYINGHHIPIIYWHCEENKGVSYARNFLLANCPTRIACWQDTDDVSNRFRLEKQYEIIKEKECLVYTSFEHLNLHTLKNINSKPHSIKNRFANASCMFVVDKDVKFDESLLIGEDNDWRLRMSLKYPEIRMQEALYYIRFHKDRLGATKGRKP